MKKAILKIINIYQKTLSPDHGVVFASSLMRCRFYPSCSQYTHEAIENLGVIKGLFKGLIRVVKCNPLSKGGIDQV